MSYTLIKLPFGEMVQRDDGAIIPPDPHNIDWQAYQAWLEAGNTPAESAPAPANVSSG